MTPPAAINKMTTTPIITIAPALEAASGGAAAIKTLMAPPESRQSVTSASPPMVAVSSHVRVGPEE
jgi:hypothetical protein